MRHKRPEYQLRQDFFSSFRKNTKNYTEFAFSLKNSANRGEVSSFLLQLFKDLPAYERLVYGNVFPQKVEELGLGIKRFYRPEKLENELYWLLIPIRHHKQQMLQFITLRTDIENLLMLGYYDEALEKLNDSVKELGYSVWHYEMKCLIYCQSGKMKEVYSMLTELNNKKKGSKFGYVTFLLAKLLDRSMPDISAFNYDYDLLSLYKRNKNEFQTDRFLYFLYRLNFYSNYERDNEATALVMESTNSLIDRYVLLLNVLNSYSAKENADNKMIGKFAKRLYGYVHDKKLLPYIAYDNIADAPKEYYDVSFIRILDAYYTGKYDDVKMLSRDYIKINPCCFDVIKLYNRALIFLKNGYSPISSKTDSLVNKLSEQVYLILIGHDHDKQLYQLYQMLKNLSGLPVAAGLDYFIREEKNEHRSLGISLFSIDCFDPLFSLMFNSDIAKNRYLEYGLEHISDSTVINYQKRRVSKQTTEDNRVVEYIRNSDNAKIVFENGDYQKALEMWMEIYDRSAFSMPTLQTAASYIYDCHIHLHHYTDAISFYVAKYIENKSIVSKVDTGFFAKMLRRNRYKGYRYNLDLLIFVFLTASSEPEKSFVLDNYCKYREVDLPSKLIQFFEDEPIAKIEEFYHLLFDDDILRHYVKINSTQEMLNEKQLIIHYLLSLDSPRHDLYLKEEAELIEEMVVYRGNRKMDESKIYANEQAIIKYELSDIDELYNRFLAQYKKTGLAVYLVDTSTGLPDENNSKEWSILAAPVKYTDSAVFEVSNEIFDRIRYAYLSSKFGLGTYLSTRIRHGVFEGEIRSVLSDHRLILNTERGKYLPNDYWKNTYGLDNESNTSFMTALTELSQGVDFSIQNFKANVLQIRTDEKQKGFFDYVIDPKKIEKVELDILVKSKSREEFCKGTIDYLHGVTDLNLYRIREEVKNGLAGSLNAVFDKFDLYISRLASSHFSDDLKTALLDVRSKMSHKLERVERWFYIQDSQFDDLTLDNITNIVWDNTKTFYPSIPVECKISIPQLIIRAEYGIHFIDLLRIFFSNMFKYSKNTLPYRTLLFSGSIDKDILYLHFENETDKPDSDLNKELQALLPSTGNLLKEGKSGLIKARKIVKYDLKCVDNDVTAFALNNKCVVDVRINMSVLEK